MYEQYFRLSEYLGRDASLIQSRRLYSLDENALYSAIMDRLAQPLPNGEESPFSSRSPTTAHAILTGGMAYQQSVLAEEFNHVPDRTLVLMLRLLGTRMSIAEYPVINQVFRRAPESLLVGIPAIIPLNLEVRSRYDPTLSVYTTLSASMEGTAGVDEVEREGVHFVSVPCRVSQIGALPNIRLREFTVLPRSLPFVSESFNDGRIVNPGRNAETLVEAVLRSREDFRTGLRCVTARDYEFAANLVGAQKVRVMVGVSPGTAGYFGSLTSVVVYPPDITPSVDAILAERVLASRQISTLPADIIPIDGVIKPRVVPNLSNLEVFNLVATAIATEVNPPYGNWGDSNFAQTVAIACERQVGIFGVPEINLRHAITGAPLESLDIQPWQLLEIQSTLQVEPLRT